MSHKTDDHRPHIDSSVDSEDISNNDVNLPKSRLSSASKKNREQHSTSVTHHDHEIRIKSPNIHHQDQNQVNDHKQTNKEQPSFNDHSRSSFHENQPTNDGPTQQNLHTLSSHDEQNQLNLNKTSIDYTTDDDDDLKSSRRQPPDLTHHRNIVKPHDNHPEVTNCDNIKSEKSEDDHANMDHPACRFHTDKQWLDLQLVGDSIKKPNDLEKEMKDPPGKIDEKILDRIQGSIIGMALGDALGAHVEFRPHEYMVTNPVTQFEGGGTWGLEKGQFTDDTSMALCLANSLVACRDFIPYDQLVRYKWWHKFGYMSSTGQCFDIGAATSQSLHEFERRQKAFSKEHNIPFKLMDKLSDRKLLSEFDTYCSDEDAAGNGALMRLAPVPLFFFRNKYAAIELSGRSGEITHGDKQAYDACRFYGALIVAALRGFTKEQILAKNFYSANKHWFGKEPLHEKIQSIAEGSYKKRGGYEGGIRGKGYIVDALEAALWAFWSDENSFEKGALNAVNLGDDTDTTAAIYGQLAGAFYGYKQLPKKWVDQIYAREFMKTLSKWIAYEGEQWSGERQNSFVKE